MPARYVFYRGEVWLMGADQARLLVESGQARYATLEERNCHTGA